jgi:hypothetical protein
LGGFGSGRTTNRSSVEGSGALILDVNVIVGWVRNALRSAGFIKLIPGSEVQTSPFNLQWLIGKELALVTLRLNLGTASGTAWLQYEFNHLSCPTGPQDYTVRLLTTSCRFGGLRWWWVCPQTGQRVAKLYLPNGGTRFLSRGPGATIWRTHRSARINTTEHTVAVGVSDASLAVRIQPPVILFPQSLPECGVVHAPD